MHYFKHSPDCLSLLFSPPSPHVLFHCCVIVVVTPSLSVLAVLVAMRVLVVLVALMVMTIILVLAVLVVMLIVHRSS